MKKLTYSLLFILPFLLAACGPPMVFFILQEQWDQLNQQQRSQIIAGYNQREQTKAQVAPLVAAFDALGAKNSNPAAATPAPATAPAPSIIPRHHHHRHHHSRDFMDPNFDIEDAPGMFIPPNVPM